MIELDGLDRLESRGRGVRDCVSFLFLLAGLLGLLAGLLGRRLGLGALALDLGQLLGRVGDVSPDVLPLVPRLGRLDGLDVHSPHHVAAARLGVLGHRLPVALLLDRLHGGGTCDKQPVGHQVPERQVGALDLRALGIDYPHASSSPN